MDCASEESEIRRAVDGIVGIRALTFQLGQRTMAMDASGAAIEQAVAAIRKAGFDPQPIASPGAHSPQGASEAEEDHEHGVESVQRPEAAEIRGAGPMSAPSTRIAAYEAAMQEAQRRLAAGDAPAALESLERAHVLGQVYFRRHLKVHWHMLRVAWLIGDRREVRGQVLRIVLAPIGHLFGRLPLGNTGRANVNAFEPMAIPPDLQPLIEERDR